MIHYTPILLGLAASALVNLIFTRWTDDELDAMIETGRISALIVYINRAWGFDLHPGILRVIAFARAWADRVVGAPPGGGK